MFRRFMYGRYGNDQLNMALLLLSLIFGFVSVCTEGIVDLIFALLQLIALAVWALRTFSKNPSNRRRENESFLRFWNSFRRSRFAESVKKAYREAEGFFRRLADRNHKYFKCPNCGSRLRVPRGRGEITVTCPRCKNCFDKKS